MKNTLLTISWVVLNFFGLHAQVFTNGSTSYQILNDGKTVSIVGYHDLNAEIVNIPKTVNYKSRTYPIVEISNCTFKDFTNLKQVILPEGLRTIQPSAFNGCKNLCSINFPITLREIGDVAFANCTNLNFEIPSSIYINKIGQQVFTNTRWLNEYNGDVCYFGNVCYKAINQNISSYQVKPGTTILASQAFQDCYNLTNIILPEGLTYIGHSAFYNCTALQKCHIPETVNYLENSIFRNCVSLAHINLPLSTRIIPENMFYGCSSLTSVDFPNGVIEIHEQAFKGCSQLKEIILPCNLESIGYCAFGNCKSVNKLVIPKNLISLGIRAWSNCSLEEVYLLNPQTDNRASFQICIPGYENPGSIYATHVEYDSDNPSVVTVNNKWGEIFFTGLTGVATVTATVIDPITKVEKFISTDFYSGVPYPQETYETSNKKESNNRFCLTKNMIGISL